METKMILLLTLIFFSSMLLDSAEAGSIRQPGGVSRELYELCHRKTSYPALCASTMAPLLNSSAPLNDPMFVFQISLKASTAEARAAIGRADQLIRTEKDVAVVESLKSCRGNFNDAVDDIQNAKDAIPSRDYGFITGRLSAAVTEFGTCDDEFTGPNKLLKSNEITRGIIDNSLAFASFVQWS